MKNNRFDTILEILVVLAASAFVVMLWAIVTNYILKGTF